MQSATGEHVQRVVQRPAVASMDGQTIYTNASFGIVLPALVVAHLQLYYILLSFFTLEVPYSRMYSCPRPLNLDR